MSNYSHPQDILETIAAHSGDIALVIVTNINGGTLRAKGALMAVTKSDVFGYISAGCVDGDIIFQAKEALKDSKPQDLIYGEGSPFRDISLPCGGTIKIKIIPNPDRRIIALAAEQLSSRQKTVLKLNGFEFEYTPKIRLRITGRSAPFTALANLGFTSGFEIIGQSPDPELAQNNFTFFDHLTNPESLPQMRDDPWTAVIFLFHDHDWEPALIKQAMSGDSFYIGAMGSPRTHNQRIETLKAMDVKNTDRIRGPIGLIPAMRDAQMLAISILAEIIDEAGKLGKLS